MAKRHEQVLKELRDLYEPLSEYYGKELNQVETLIRQYEQSKDPEWKSFREHPVTKKIFKHSAGVYRRSKMQLANDDGTLSKEDRIRLYVSTLWALYYIRFVGQDPLKVQEDVEREIDKMALSAGLDLPDDELSTEGGE
jgi:hypothetical protein